MGIHNAINGKREDIMLEEIKGEFRTSDTPLSAYLLSEGFQLLEIDYSQPRITFIFKDDSKKLKELVRAFYRLEAEGNIPLFFDSYKRLSKMIRNKLPA